LDYYFIYEGVLSMPIYEYTCKQCGKEFERVVLSGNEKGITCPECKSKDVKKNMSASTFMGASIGSCATPFPNGPS
jgi:putative FmdB family regulatory protein